MVLLFFLGGVVCQGFIEGGGSSLRGEDYSPAVFDDDPGGIRSLVMLAGE